MQKEKNLKSLFLDLQDLDKTAVSLLAINIDYLSEKDQIDCLKKVGRNLPPNTHDLKATVDALIEEGCILRDIKGLCCAEEIRQTVLIESLKDGNFSFLASLLQNKFPAEKDVLLPGDSTFYRKLRDLQIAIFSNQPIEQISEIMLDLYYRFPKECEDTGPLFYLLDNPFSVELIQKIPPFNRVLLLGMMISRAEDQLLPVTHILDYWFSLYKAGKFEIPVTELLSALLLRGRYQDVEDILYNDDLDEQALPTAHLELYRGSLSFIRGHNDKALGNFRKSLTLLNLHSREVEFLPEGFPGFFFFLSFLRAGTRESLQEGLRYLEMVYGIGGCSCQEYCRNFIEIFCDQLDKPIDLWGRASGQISEFPLKQMLPGRTKSLLNEFFFILTSFWLGSSEAQKSRNTLEHIREKAVKGEYLWLVAESTDLLASLEQKGGQNKDYARSIHEKLGSVSIVDIVHPRPRWEKTLNALLHINPVENKDVEEQAVRRRIVWWFRYNEHDKSCSLQPRIQKSSRNGNWSKGRPLSLKQLYHDALDMEALSSHDLRICRTISESNSLTNGWKHNVPKNVYRFDYNETVPALIGHPLIFLEDSPETRIELVKGEPEVRAIVKRGGVRLSIEPVPEFGNESYVQIVRDSPTRFKVIRFNEQQRQIQKIIGEGVLFPKNCGSRLQEVLSRISGSVAIRSDLGTIGGEVKEVKTDSRPHIQLVPYREGLRLAVLIKPIPGANVCFQPGRDGRHVMADIEGVRVQARRNLGKEKELVGRLFDSCPILCQNIEDKAASAEGEIFLYDPEECLEILQELKDCREDVVLEWPKGERFRMRKTVISSDLSLHIKKDRNWFKATGSLIVDENYSMELGELIDRLEKSKGRFIPLDDGSFLTLTRQFRERLEDLKSYSSRSGKGRKFHPLTAPALNDLTSEVGDLTCDGYWNINIERLKEVVEPKVPNDLKADLRDYQIAGFKWLAKLAHWGVGGCLADDMGLGKTVQALAAVLLNASKGPALVVAPLSVINNWKEEAKQFTPSLGIKIFGQGDRQYFLEQIGPFDLVLVSYGLLQVEVERLSNISWQTVILDEAQAIKNRRTKRSRAAMALQAEFKLITTGTPVENHPGEMWTLFNFINPGLLGSYKHFHENFTLPIERDQDRDASARLRKLIQPFILRRVKSEVLQELPPRTDITLEVEMSRQEAELYASQRLRALRKLENGPKKDRHFRILAEITRLRRLCCNPALVWPEINITGSKLKVFGDTLHELLDNGHKVLVFSQFVDHLHIIREYLQDQNIEYQYLDGSSPALQRNKSIKHFQEGKGDVFLISLKAGGFGLNLSAADFVIHMDPWWNPAVEDQASDRAHRLGQQRPVTVYRLVMKNSIEEQIVELHAKKRELADSLLEGSDVAGRIPTEQLLELLKG